jgi:ATP-dependent Lon protease
VRLPGYTREEKVDLARRFLLPRAIDEAGAPAAAVELAPDAIERLAFAHSPEPGVRLLARRVAEVVRRAAARIALGEASAARLDAAAVDALLGPPPPSQTGLFVRARRPDPGVSAAVVWAADGAEVALVEALRDRRAVVAREGAAALEASLALVDARADQLRVEAGALAGRDVSLRITGPRPLGDDGAADLAVFLAVASLATDRPVRHDVAAAGALSLRGAVRSVAGLAEKVLAAARAGARKVLVPAADFAALGAELPATALAAIEVVPVAHADDATREALIDIVIAQELR